MHATGENTPLQCCTRPPHTSAVPARLTHGGLAGVVGCKIGGAKRKRRSVTAESRIPDRDHQFWYADCSSCTTDNVRQSEETTSWIPPTAMVSRLGCSHLQAKERRWRSQDGRPLRMFQVKSSVTRPREMPVELLLMK